MDGATTGDSERSGPRVSLIVGIVLAGATLLVLLTIGAVFVLSMISESANPTYAVGDCVIQAGASAEPTDCGDPDAFRIVSEVNSREECPDPAQPAVEVAGPPVQVFCLEPAGGGE